MLTIETEVGPIPAIREGDGADGILLATGAGTGHNHPGVAGLRSRLAAAGLLVMSFEYPYRAAGRKFPDRPPKLLAAHRAAAEHLRRDVDRLVLAGRSMGGRMSTMLAADGQECAGVVVYGYPLHTIGKPDRLRIEHLGDMAVPSLFISGDRDALAPTALIDRHLRPLERATVEIVEGADHSFRRAGTSPDGMLDPLAEISTRWLRSDPGLAVEGTGWA